MPPGIVGANRTSAQVCWIAAHACCLGMTLVTNNIREFDRVRGLKVENRV